VRLPILLALFVTAVAMVALARVRMRRYHETSVRDGLARFSAAFASENLPAELLQQTYSHLVERREAVGDDDVTHFIVSPGHDLRSVYHLDGLDIEDAALLIADRASARLPKSHDLDDMKGRVTTVRDLVLFLAPYFETERVSQ
jgi:hypothetical protein